MKPAPLVVYQGTNTNGMSSVAHVILPSAVAAEKDGTFTNIQGRVQRIWPAVTPLGESKPDSQILIELAALLGVPLNLPDAQSAFAQLAKQEPAFAGLTYEAIADHGALLPGVTAGNGH